MGSKEATLNENRREGRLSKQPNSPAKKEDHTMSVITFDFAYANGSVDLHEACTEKYEELYDIPLGGVSFGARVGPVCECCFNKNKKWARMSLRESIFGAIEEARLDGVDIRGMVEASNKYLDRVQFFAGKNCIKFGVPGEKRRDLKKFGFSSVMGILGLSEEGAKS